MDGVDRSVSGNFSFVKGEKNAVKLQKKLGSMVKTSTTKWME